MRYVVLALVSVALLMSPWLWVFDLAGKVFSAIRGRGRAPKTSAELRKEFPGQLDESIHIVFAQAVERHIQGDLEGAHLEYQKLRAIPRADGTTFDLAQVSKTLRHNLDLLEKK
jgi:hypothetical protein